MMEIRVVWMTVHERLVPVRVTVRLARRIIGRMSVLVMFVVDMEVLVLHHLVRVLVFMAFAQVQPHAEAHQYRADHQRYGRRLVEDGERDQRADEWRDGEVGARPRGADVTERDHEQHETQAIAEEAERKRSRDT